MKHQRPNTGTTRRSFLIVCGSVAAGAAAGSVPDTLRATAGAETERTGASEPPSPQRITLAQMLVTQSVAQNMQRITAAITQAKADNAGWVFFPECALSGYHGGFKQAEVEEAFAEVCRLCQQANLIGLISTCWHEGEAKPHNEIRLVERNGALASRYAKTCLTYSDERDFAAGGFPLVHSLGGLTVGTLICNDLWVTPGYTDGPNPHLSLKQARAGAQVIFHAVNSGGNQKYRAYHESNQALRASEAGCPLVTVNAAVPEGEVNCTSGVVLPSMEYGAALPRQGEVVQTVEFTPKAATAEPGR